jgi:dolichol kinase
MHPHEYPAPEAGSLLFMGVIRKELLRKSFHLTGLAIPILYYFFLSRDGTLLCLVAAVAVAGSLEAVRLSGYDIYPDLLLRDPSEKRRLYGYFWGLLSMLLVVFLFDKIVAVACMLFMLLGDSAAGLAGAAIVRHEPKPLVRPKPLYVMAVMFFTCIASGLLLYPSLSLPVLVAGATGATVAESFPLRILGNNINDNLSIPLVAGAIMTLGVCIIIFF